MQVAYSGTYLGVNIGPENSQGFWDKAMEKYSQRAKDWGKLRLGMHCVDLHGLGATNAVIFGLLQNPR